jgi:hypothetical protein
MAKKRTRRKKTTTNEQPAPDGVEEENMEGVDGPAESDEPAEDDQGDEDDPVAEAEEAAEVEPAPEPTRERCRDALFVHSGDLVRFWLPINGAADRLIETKVTHVYDPIDDDCQPAIDIAYMAQRGRQTRTHVPYCQAGDRRTGRWVEFPPLPAPAPAE